MAKPEQTDFDSPWKDALEHFFPAAMQLYFPQAHARIDWRRGVAFLDKELQRVTPRAARGRRTVDKLAKVYLNDGHEVWVLVHVEVQGQPEEAFPDRMYEYNYRLYDRYARPVASFGILADARRGWRPSRYRREVLGCEVSLRFPVVKLLDYRERREELEESDNPIAVLTLAQLIVLETAKDPHRRLSGKRYAVRRLRDLGLSQEQREELFRLVDWLVALPAELQLSFDEELEREAKEGTVPYVSSFERRAIAKGRQEGLVQGRVALLAAQLEAKFGPLDEATRQRLAEADPETLVAWGVRAMTAERLEDVFAAA
jgi:hypothetical protein